MPRANRSATLTYLTLCLPAAVALLSCQKEEIESYEVPRVTEQSLAKIRLVAAIVSHGDKTWFFKLTGPEQDVGRYRDEFLGFLATVRFTDQAERQVLWDLPGGWQEERGNQLRYATIHPDPKNPAAELTVVALGREAGSLLANVNRWRGQIGLTEISEADLAKVTQSTKVGGTDSTLVDMSGNAPAAGAKRPPFAQRGMSTPEAPKRSGALIRFDKPEGWKEVPDSTGFRAASFEVSQDGQRAEITVIPLGPSAGTLADNVKRWREQIGLSRVTQEEVEKDTRRVTVDGEPATFVDLLGPESAGRQREEILAVMLTRRERSWFFKMKGPAELVSKQKGAFEAFLKSVRFNEAQE